MHFLLLLSLYLHPPALVAWPEIPPPLSDLQRFPSAEVCKDQLAFFAARRQWLDARRGLFADPMYAAWFEDANADLNARVTPWVALSNAHYYSRGDLHRQRWYIDAAGNECHEEWDGPDVKAVRGYLWQLRTLLGAYYYDIGALPGPIDFRYVRRAD
jgi:hypothetical protein